VWVCGKKTKIQSPIEMTPYLVHHFLENSASRFPDKIALIHEETRATYAEINSKANQLAQWLLSQGIHKGDRAAFIFENCLEYVISYYGALKAGAVAVPLSTDLKPDGLAPLLTELEAKVILSSPRFEKILNASNLETIQNSKLLIQNSKLNWSARNVSATSWDDVVGDQNTSMPAVASAESDLASIIYTSGSTGTPKGVMLSHKNLVSNVHSICQYLAISKKDIQMVVLPFFYVMGQSLLNTHFAAGGTVVINNKFAYPATVIEQMVTEKVSAFSGVPSTYAYLLHRSPLKKYKSKLESLRYCSQAGGHMSDQIKTALREVLPEHTRIYIMYGATEASARLTSLEPERYRQKMGSIGKPIPGVTLQVLDEGGRPMPPGRTGELVASGPNIMQGYWKDQETTDRLLTKAGYHTGDLGYQDEEGYFYVNGRRDNLLKVGGHRINIQGVEDALMATKLIVEAAVLGLPDKLLGNKLVAVAAPVNGVCNQNDLLSLCARMLPKHKVPSEIKFVRSLPKYTNGKINRARCLELIK
jgi:acyl-CoA synthetase (AMP-forming)/AMP-acid ligase II